MAHVHSCLLLLLRRQECHNLRWKPGSIPPGTRIVLLTVQVDDDDAYNRLKTPRECCVNQVPIGTA